jgi:hypothetical protein
MTKDWTAKNPMNGQLNEQETNYPKPWQPWNTESARF